MRPATSSIGSVLILAACLSPALGESRVTLTETKGNYTVDTGGGLVFAVSRANGDLTSMNYKGRECQAAPKDGARYSHYASGLDGDSKITADQDPAGHWAKITIEDDRIGLTHYYLARRGEAAIYMADFAMACPPPGEMRFIAYLDRAVFTHVPAASDNSRSDDGVEGKDVFRNTRTGATSSKFYGATPIIDGLVHGVTGEGIGCYMDMGRRETSSGGPFFRDIENQSGGKATEHYNYLFSGHTQTEPFRPGLKGPYALQFTDGPPPVRPDYAFVAGLGLKGYVPTSGRGTLGGKVSGVMTGHRATLALSNAAAQYWATPDAKGVYAIKDALPGDYVQTLYDVELAVARKGVTISAGRPTTSDIAAMRLVPPAVFRIGTWDGTPLGFLNADNINDHHPSDSCIKPFTAGNFVVGKSKPEEWPLAEWRDVNDGQRITFDVTSEQAKTPLTLRIGVTLTYVEGRPSIEVNAGTPQAWKGPAVEPSKQPEQSRGITRGTYRGNNDIFAFDLPPATLHAGTNTITIHVQGKSKAYPGFLSPNIVFDAIDLVTTADAAKAKASLPEK